MVVVDAVTRLVPGTLGSETSAVHESFSTGSTGRLDFPHYTRPAEFRGFRVPDVLLSGHHGEVDKWRRRAALIKTKRVRPDLLEQAALTEEDRLWLSEAEHD
jgi:tRNA (guanine37-N1)-methyltransferase